MIILVMSKKSKTTIDDLAVMIKNGFDNTATKKQVDNLEKRVIRLENNVKFLAKGQDRIELRLTNVVYRFELVELQKRVELLEKEAGVK